MYRNSGAKIKGIAQDFFFIDILISIAVAIGVYDFAESLVAAVVVFAIFAFFSWISHIVLYGFGEIVEKICAIEAALNPATETDKDTAVPSDDEIICPICGNVQKGGKYCSRCGTYL
jgi:hypothetical protein